MREQKPPGRAEPPTELDAIDRNQALAVDIMFIDTIAFFTSVSDPLGLMIAIPIKKRNAEALWAAYHSHHVSYSSRGFKINSVQFDGEGGLGTLSDRFRALGVEPRILRGEHAPAIENRHRTLKNRCRTLIAHSKFPIWRQMIEPLVMYCLSRMNSSPSSARPDGRSPREIFLGRKISFTKELGCGFLDYVVVKVPGVVKNSMQGRTEAALALYPSGATQASWRVLLLKSGTIVTRERVTVLPMPTEVLQWLIEIGKEQRKAFPASPIFRIGDRVMPDDGEIEERQANVPVIPRLPAGGAPANAADADAGLPDHIAEGAPLGGVGISGTDGQTESVAMEAAAAQAA